MSDLPEPHIELAPLAERVKIWTVCALFCAVVWAALAKVFLL